MPGEARAEGISGPDQLARNPVARRNPESLRSPHVVISEKDQEALARMEAGMKRSRAHFVEARGMEMDELRTAGSLLRKLRESGQFFFVV
jgi:hypothetical protein